MLATEIEPFADHHIQKLDTISNQIADLLPTITDPDIRAVFVEWQKSTIGAANALTRFKICMADECRQKENFRIKARTCRLEHRDK